MHCVRLKPDPFPALAHAYRPGQFHRDALVISAFVKISFEPEFIQLDLLPFDYQTERFEFVAHQFHWLTVKDLGGNGFVGHQCNRRYVENGGNLRQPGKCKVGLATLNITVSRGRQAEQIGHVLLRQAALEPLQPDSFGEGMLHVK